MGLALEIAKVGDLVTVLLGSRRPIILRAKNDNYYEVIGQAYCEGLMDGEALLGPLPDHYEMVTTEPWWPFMDHKTGNNQAEDPRLGPLP